MKKIFYALFAAAFAMSCSEATVDEGAIQPEAGQGTPIEFYAEGSADSRTTYFEGDGMSVYWEEGDLVPIIARRKDASTTNGEYRTRIQYAAQNVSGASATFMPTKETTVFTGETLVGEVAISETAIDWASFYCNPYSTATTFYCGVLVNSDYEQVQAAAGNYSHIGDYMVMASDMVHREVGDTTPVTFKYTNVTSIVELTLKSNAVKNLKSIELSSATTSLGFKKAYLCFEDFRFTDEVETPYELYPESVASNGKVTSGDLSKKVTLTLTEPAALSAEGVKLYLVVMPGEHAAGDITLTARCDDNSIATVEMGAITFEKNKVYRPVVTLNEFDNKTYAEIKHVFSDGYSHTIPFENGAQVIKERYTHPLANVPAEFAGFDVATITPSTYPTVNKIEALTDGYAYLLVGSSGNATATNAEKADTFFKGKGWTNVTAIPTAALTENPSADSNMIYYENGTSPGPLVIYEGYMKAGDVFDLNEYVAVVKNFQGIRPVAKEIVNESDKLTLYFNFTDQSQGWEWYTSYSNVNANAFEGLVPYNYPGGVIYNLDFSRTPITAENPGGGSGLHDDGYLLMYLRNSTAESIGLPAIEGYKLATAAGRSVKGTQTPTVGISSVAAPAAPSYLKTVGGEDASYEFDNANAEKTWSFDLQNTEANTSYYFYATDKVSGNQDLRLKFFTLVYDKVQ